MAPGEGHRLTTLDGGLRVVTERMDSVRSVALGVWIGTGSVGESEPQAGLSHLIEHMLFRGTDRYASLEIDQLFDAMGAELNAGTGKETTSVFARVLDRHLDRALDVMADMVWRPKFDPSDLDAERYVPSNVVVSAAGSVDHDELVEMVRRAGAERSGAIAPQAPAAPSPQAGTVRFVTKDTEQYHVCLGAPGLARDDDRRFALRVLDNVLGGTSSSRLFQEVREKRGLAYSVYSFQSLFAGTGQIGLYLGTRPDNVKTALGVVGDELDRFRADPATPDELDRAKENVKGRVLLALESTTARMNRLGSSVLGGMPLLSVDEVEARIDAVSVEDLRALSAELLDPSRLSAAGVGADEDVFRTALEPIVGALAA